MNNITKYNIELFQISDKPERHQHFLVFMIRKFFGFNFDGTFNRVDFIKTGIEKYGYNKNTIKGIFDKGIKDNKYILKDYIKRGKKYYVLKSNTNKNEHNIIIKIEKEIMNKITSVNIFYTFCFLLIAAKPFIYKFKIDIGDFKKIKGRTLNTIGETFNNFKKDNVLYHINNGKELFKPYFNVITRHIPFYNHTISISSLYIFDGIDYYSDKKHKKEDYLYSNNLHYYIKDMTNCELKKYGLEISYKNGIKNLDFTFGEDLDLGRHFLDKNGKILYDELYSENYGKIIEKVISQY